MRVKRQLIGNCGRGTITYRAVNKAGIGRTYKRMTSAKRWARA